MTALTLLSGKLIKRRPSHARKHRNRLSGVESVVSARQHFQLQTLADELEQEVRREQVIEFEAERIRHNMQTQLDAQRDAEIGMRMRNLLNRRNEAALIMILAAA